MNTNISHLKSQFSELPLLLALEDQQSRLYKLAGEAYTAGNIALQRAIYKEIDNISEIKALAEKTISAYRDSMPEEEFPPIDLDDWG